MSDLGKIGTCRQIFAKIQNNILSFTELRLLGVLCSTCTDGRREKFSTQAAHFRNCFAEAHATARERIS